MAGKKDEENAAKIQAAAEKQRQKEEKDAADAAAKARAEADKAAEEEAARREKEGADALKAQEKHAADLNNLPDTPSGLALKKVGPDGDGEEYAKEKAKHRWG